MNIKLTLRGQELIADAPLLAEQTIGKLFCSVEADSEWDGLAIRLVFRSVNALGQIARSEFVRDYSSVEVPPECIRPGYLFINAIGVADGGNKRLPTADMPIGLTIHRVSGMDAPTANPVMPNEYDKILSLIGNLADVPVQDASSVVAILQLMFAQIGDVSKLDTDDLVAAIRAAKIHVVKGICTDGIAYTVSGDLPSVAAGDGGKHIGKGLQIVFVPDAVNTTSAPTLTINDGKAIEIRVRAAKNQSDNEQAPEATMPVPVGALMRGVPYTMTFCGKYWLIDSHIPLLSCASNEDEAALMREFATRAMSVSDADMIAVPVINSADELPDGSEVGLAQIVRGENEESDPNGSVEIPTVAKVQEIAEQNAGGTKIPIVKEVPADMKDGDIAILQIEGDESEDGEDAEPDDVPDGDFVTQEEMEAYVDETVPEWARQKNKPSYTAKEVGAATPAYVDDAIKNLPIGGGDKWEFIGEFITPEDVAEWTIDTDANGNPIELSKMFCLYQFQPANGATESAYVYWGNAANRYPKATNSEIRRSTVYLSPRTEYYWAEWFLDPNSQGNFIRAFARTSTLTLTWSCGESDSRGVNKQGIGGVVIYNVSAAVIGANSTVKIWGVRI